MYMRENILDLIMGYSLETLLTQASFSGAIKKYYSHRLASLLCVAEMKWFISCVLLHLNSLAKVTFIWENEFQKCVCKKSLCLLEFIILYFQRASFPDVYFCCELTNTLKFIHIYFLDVEWSTWLFDSYKHIVQCALLYCIE